MVVLTFTGSGFIIDYTLLEVIGAFFLLYARYGDALVKRKILNNKNIKIIRNGAMDIIQSDSTTTLTIKTIKDFKINI